MRLSRWLLVVVPVAVVIASVVVGGARTETTMTLPIRVEASVVKKAVVSRVERRQLVKFRNTVVVFRRKTWVCQDTLGVKRSRSSSSVWALPTSVPYRQWTAMMWKQRASSCQAALDLRTIPLTSDWVSAVEMVQRIYPGTQDWMLSISDREGGWGRWVWYGGRSWSGYHIGDDFLGADTVGGWMQFRFSTFDPYWRAAREDLRRRGFVVPVFPDRGGPAKYQPWLDPVGQALTAGYMKWSGREGCHWCL